MRSTDTLFLAKLAWNVDHFGVVYIVVQTLKFTIANNLFCEAIDGSRRSGAGGSIRRRTQHKCGEISVVTRVAGLPKRNRKHKGFARPDSSLVARVSIATRVCDLERAVAKCCNSGITAFHSGHCSSRCCYRRHSGRGCSKHRHVSVVGRIQASSTSGVLCRCHARRSNSVLCGLRFLNRRHSGRGRSHRRHSGLMRTKHSPFRTSMYNVNTSKIERGNTH